MAINLVVLAGRWTRQPELRYSPEGVAVAWSTLAVDRPPRKDGEKAGTDFIRVVVFGKSAEAVATHTDKGSRVTILGRLRQRRYEAKDGSAREVIEVVADWVEFGGNGNGNGNGAKRRAAASEEIDPLDLLMEGDLGEGLDGLDDAGPFA
jgi:single-strand DNA-binding protein